MRSLKRKEGPARESGVHYDRITDLWIRLMGPDFHFGYYAATGGGLEEAAAELVRQLAEAVPLRGGERVLDLGCGVGAPALHLARHYGCTVTGVTNSGRGAERARELARREGVESVEFVEADALDEGAAAGPFDVVWVMESSHSIGDLPALMKRAFGALVEGGSLALCDLVQVGKLPFTRAFFNFVRGLPGAFAVARAFGPARIYPLGSYCQEAVRAGFRAIKVREISDEVFPTLRNWRERGSRMWEEAGEEETHRYLEDFIRACRSLEAVFQQGVMGYMLFVAHKPRAGR